MMTIPIYSISIVLMVLLPVIFAALLRKRVKVPWLLFCVGMITFTASQAVHIPLNNLLGKIGFLPDTLAEVNSHLLKASLILGATAGICEELARTAGYAILKRWRKDEHGIMLGLGHGGIESMVLGGVLTAATVSSLWGLRSTDLTTLNLSTDQLSSLTLQMDHFLRLPWMGFLPLFERLLAMLFHVMCSALVLKAFQKKNGFYVLTAILYHALFDAGFVYIQYRWNNVLVSYAFILAVMIPGIIWMARKIKLPEFQSSGRKRKFAGDTQMFWLAFKKEMLQQWRSRRILVVGVVFLLFGLGSPLIAKYMPEVMKSVSGAEMFANLIPEPSMKDAIGQYIKNLTQFGFILAILLGMASVVGEKERGTIAMILSKPLPRWAFISSKFAAQFVVYLLAFLVAGIGAYYYTFILFGPPDPAKFALVNLLLLMWLLTFVGVTLLASVLGTSTGAAAGIALALSVILMLSANIPNVGMLMPGGLTTWAAGLGEDMGVQAASTAASMAGGNAGAMVMAGVIVLVSLLTALAVFERQEI